MSSACLANIARLVLLVFLSHAGTAVPALVCPDGSVVYLGLRPETGGEGASADQLATQVCEIVAWGASTRKSTSSVASRAKANVAKRGNGLSDATNRLFNGGN